VKENSHNRLSIAVNSTAYFIISYLIVYFVTQFTTTVTALSCNIPVQFFYNKIEFLVRSTVWTSDTIKIVFSVGPITALILGVLCLIMYSKVTDTNGLLKLFFLWGYVHGFTIFFGSILIGTFVNQGFGYVLNWLYLFDTAKLILILLSAMVMLFIGLFTLKFFLISANSYYNVQYPRNRKSFLTNQILIPWIIGGFLVNLFKIPIDQHFGISQYFIYNLLVFCTSLLIIVPPYFRVYRYSELYFDEEPKNFSISWIALIVSILMFFVFRIGLNWGIRFN